MASLDSVLICGTQGLSGVSTPPLDKDAPPKDSRFCSALQLFASLDTTSSRAETVAVPGSQAGPALPCPALP